MAKLHETKIDIPAANREKLIAVLNKNLANGLSLQLQSKQAHWNVKGTDFIQLHELFDQVYLSATEWVDLLAERAVILGGVAEGTIESVSKRTNLPAYSLDISSGKEHVNSLSTAIAAFAKDARAAIVEAEKSSDMVTADLFTEVARAADKQLWFVEAHLQS